MNATEALRIHDKARKQMDAENAKWQREYAVQLRQKTAAAKKAFWDGLVEAIDAKIKHIAERGGREFDSSDIVRMEGDQHLLIKPMMKYYEDLGFKTEEWVFGFKVSW